MKKRINGLVCKHTCNCGNTWESPIVLSDDTQNLSGEKTEFCPKCGKRAFMSSAPYNPDTINYRD